MILTKNGAELESFSLNFVSQVRARAEAWEIPQSEVDALDEACNRFGTLLAQCNSPVRTKVIVAQKNEARDTLLRLIRGMIGFRLRNPAITDDERVALGLKVRERRNTPVAVPATHPVFDVKAKDVRRIQVSFPSRNKAFHGKPYGIRGALIAYAVSDTPVVNTAALTKSVLATRSPHILTFGDEERSKTVYLALRWQNTKGQTGPMSGIESAIIP